MKNKIFHIILLFTLAFVVNNARAQINLNKKISINIQNLPVTEILSIIEQENNLYFAYDPEQVTTGKLLSINKENTSIRNILNEILESRFTYKPVGNHIILNLKSQALTIQTYTISGTILNVDNMPIDSVIIYAVKDKSAAISDKNGSYTINLQSRPQFINISHPRFKDTLILAETIEKGIIIELHPKEEHVKNNIDVKLDSKLPEIKPTKTSFEDIGLVSRIVPPEAVYIANQIKVNEHVPIQFSFIPGLGTNSLYKGLRTNIFSINLIAGYSGGLYGVEIGSLANIIQNDVIGAQFGGLTNIVNNNTVGVQVAGLTNYTFGYVKGAQIAGIGNIGRSTFTGAQLGGIFNINRDNISGVQIAGICNIATSIKGLQLSDIANISTGEITGVQFSGIFNIAKKINGLQLGLINIADTVEKGLQIGLFNIVRNGYCKFELTSNETYAFDFFYKTGGKRLYSTLNLGFDKNEVGIGYGIGLFQPLYKKLSLSIDGMSTAMLSTDAQNTYQGNKVSARLALNYDFSEHFGITTGISANFFNPNDENENITSSNGIEFKSNSNNLIDKAIETNESVAWIGWFVGIRI